MTIVNYSRRKTRRFLFQSLYANHFGNALTSDLEESFFKDNMLEGIDRKYFQSMYDGIIEKEDELVYIISKHIKKFDIDRMEIEQILPMIIGIYEILFFEEELPAKVIINEAVELAKFFADDATKKLTNGVLSIVLENRLALEKELDKLERREKRLFYKISG